MRIEATDAAEVVLEAVFVQAIDHAKRSQFGAAQAEVIEEMQDTQTLRRVQSSQAGSISLR
ncbi:MAG: hypothetical protein WA621_17200 [Candidatus Acidiferrum sp.]